MVLIGLIFSNEFVQAVTDGGMSRKLAAAKRFEIE